MEAKTFMFELLLTYDFFDGNTHATHSHIRMDIYVYVKKYSNYLFVTNGSENIHVARRLAVASPDI